MSTPRYLRAPHVAVLAECSTRTIERAVDAGRLRCSIIGNRRLFDPADVELWLVSCRR